MAMKTENEDISAIRENKKKKTLADKKEKTFKKKETMLTRYCGKQHKLKKEECPAFGKTCLNCKWRNHFSTVCRAPRKSSKRSPVQNISETEDEEIESETEVLEINHKIGKENSVKANILINGKQVRVILDTGASTNVMSRNIYEEVSGDKTEEADND